MTVKEYSSVKGAARLEKEFTPDDAPLARLRNLLDETPPVTFEGKPAHQFWSKQLRRFGLAALLIGGLAPRAHAQTRAEESARILANCACYSNVTALPTPIAPGASTIFVEVFSAQVYHRDGTFAIFRGAGRGHGRIGGQAIRYGRAPWASPFTPGRAGGRGAVRRH